MASLADLTPVLPLATDLGITGTTVLATIVAGLTWILKDLSSDPSYIVHDLTQYECDFVIIGAGSAGAVVANRLSEISDWNIVLMEAGLLENPVSDIPLTAASLQLTKLDWQYKTEPEDTSCLAMTDGRCNWPRGKVVGGSSVLNYMLYVRGNEGDYENWKSNGNEGWGYEDVLPYFIKAEDNQDPELVENGYHGSGGPLTVMKPPYHTPLAEAFLQGGIELGYAIQDYNGANQTAFSFAEATLRRGSRCSTGKAYAKPASQRPNVHMLLESHALKILIDPETQTAYGVEYSQYGLVKTMKVRKEVILCAGAIGSPQLLMLSGIGPKEDLEELGIPVLQDLRVGCNLQDHPGLGGLTFLVNDTVGIDIQKLGRLETVSDYVLKGEGPLTIPGAVEGLAFVRTKYAADCDYPDLQLHFVCGSTNTDFGVQTWRAHGLEKWYYKKVFQFIEGLDVWSILPMVLRPKSRGFIKLKTTDPYDHPLLYPHYLSDPEGMDIKILIEGVKIAMNLSQTQAFQKYGSQFYDKKWPGCEDLEFFTDAMWECMIRHYTFIYSHFSGTAKMGPDTDTNAVVNPELKVRGIKRLRVVDASIMPEVTSGNINAVVIMIAEKASDIIKKSWLENFKSTEDAFI